MGESLVARRPRTDLECEDAGNEKSVGNAPPYRPVTTLQNIRVLIATNDKEREQAYRLRYQVYCVENNFEPATLHPDGRETDLYDAQSVHSLLIYRDTGTVAGTTRLILPCQKNEGLPLPTPQICAPHMLAAHSHRIPADSTAELSRFAISKSERRPHRTAYKTGPDTKTPEVLSRRSLSAISLGLMRAVVAMAHSNGITHLYALMEPALLRMLQGLGIHFELLGPIVQYHGRRQPCFCDLDQLLKTTLIERPDIWAILTVHGGLWPERPERQERNPSSTARSGRDLRDFTRDRTHALLESVIR